MRLVFVIFFIITFVSGCGQKTELIPFGNKKSELLKLENFSDDAAPKNIILVIGDGTGLNQITLSRIAIGGPDHKLFIDQMPHHGISLTHSQNSLVTDSAAASTAWATGFKTKNRYVSVDENKKELETIIEKLHLKGFASGLVATSSITHATPAAFYSHVDSRYKEDEIANQLLSASINIALGGGLEFFNLDEIKHSHELILDKDLLNVNFKSSKDVLGLFDQDGIVRSNSKPTQREMTNFALNYLANKECEGFFLMSEGSQIDWAAHDNDALTMIEEFKDFDNTIKDLINFVTKDRETLLVITADHETGGLQILKDEDSSVKVQWGTGRHTGIPVGVYAYGPGSHLFTGTMDNTEIHFKILEAINFNELTETICN